jgi:hypothetical protein
MALERILKQYFDSLTDEQGKGKDDWQQESTECSSRNTLLFWKNLPQANDKVI